MNKAKKPRAPRRPRVKMPEVLSMEDGPVYAASIEVRGVGKGMAYICMKEGYDFNDQYFNASQCIQLGKWLIEAGRFMKHQSKRGRGE